MNRLAAALVVAAVAWPILLAAALAARVEHEAVWSTGVYLFASRICHQRPDRSLSTAGVQWPVCGRCAGLYAAAPLGAVAALAGARRRKRRASDAMRLLAWAALPTIATVVLEWGSLAPVDSMTRLLAALPLGAALAYTLVATVTRSRRVPAPVAIK